MFLTAEELSLDISQASDGLEPKIVFSRVDDGDDLLVEEVSFGLFFVVMEVLLQFLREDDRQRSHLLFAADGDVLSHHSELSSRWS